MTVHISVSYTRNVIISIVKRNWYNWSVNNTEMLLYGYNDNNECVSSWIHETCKHT